MNNLLKLVMDALKKRGELIKRIEDKQRDLKDTLERKEKKNNDDSKQ